MDHKLEKPDRDSRVDARILRSRAALRGALLALLADREFASLTVADIVARAKVGYATFFRRYADKEALLAEIAESLIAELTARMAPLVLTGDASAASSVLVERVQADRPLFRALLLGAGEPLRRTMVDRAIQMSLAWPAGNEAHDLPRELAVLHMVTATLTVLGWWLQEPRDLPAAELESILRRLVIDPIGIRPERT